MKAIWIIGIALLLAGCITPGTGRGGDAFTYGVPFTLSEGESRSSETGQLGVTLVSLADSRCKVEEGMVCIWEGELSAGLEIADRGDGNKKYEINLGTVRNTAERFADFEVELVQVDIDARRAVLKISSVRGT